MPTARLAETAPNVRPAVLPMLDDDKNIIFSLARHPKWRTVHYVLYAYDGRWRIGCTGLDLEEEWTQGVTRQSEVTCRVCLGLNWEGNRSRRAVNGKWWTY